MKRIFCLLLLGGFLGVIGIIKITAVSAQTFKLDSSKTSITSPIYQSPSQRFCAPYYQYSLPDSDTVCKDTQDRVVPSANYTYLCRLGTMTCPPNNAPTSFRSGRIPDYFSCSQVKTGDELLYYPSSQEPCDPDDFRCGVAKLNISYANSLDLNCPSGLIALAGNSDISGNLAFYYCVPPGAIATSIDDKINEKACEGTETKGQIIGTTAEGEYCCKKSTAPILQSPYLYKDYPIYQK